MAKVDCYEALGIPRNASAEDIKKAYRKLAMECHPDRNPGDHVAEHRFKELSEAYDILKDDGKRAAYDRYGHQAFENGGGGGGRGAGDFGFNSFSDIFEEVFGGMRGQASAPGRGSDLRYNLEVTLEDAFKGNAPPSAYPAGQPAKVARVRAGRTARSP